MTLQELLSALLIVLGLFFLAVGALGFLRLPDVFSRLHVTGIVDTLGAPLVLLGAALYLAPQLVSLKLLLAIVFIAVTSPLLGHLLARAALEAGHRPRLLVDEDPPVEARLPGADETSR